MTPTVIQVDDPPRPEDPPAWIAEGGAGGGLVNLDPETEEPLGADGRQEHGAAEEANAKANEPAAPEPKTSPPLAPVTDEPAATPTEQPSQDAAPDKLAPPKSPPKPSPKKIPEMLRFQKKPLGERKVIAKAAKYNDGTYWAKLALRCARSFWLMYAQDQAAFRDPVQEDWQASCQQGGNGDFQCTWW